MFPRDPASAEINNATGCMKFFLLKVLYKCLCYQGQCKVSEVFLWEQESNYSAIENKCLVSVKFILTPLLI